ncbi:phosphotriesterase [Kitasatospora sp. NPDC101183]|uniref:phosphotriesterase family protein n=1 Tax=Kitasatospora sp. NPDC101183 TaxID=3364100 RepID=UPI0038145268
MEPLPGTVVTVTGERDPATLGTVLPHEHLLGDFTPLAAGPLDHAPLTMELLGAAALGAANRDDQILDDEGLAAAEARDRAGTVVDLTTADLGRDPAALRRIAEATGLAVVMGAGLHRPLSDSSADTLTAALLRELVEGVDGVRAGIIGELAALDPADPAERALLTAAARASAATGAAISLTLGPDPAVQQRVLDLLAAEGADLTRVAVGRCDPLAADPGALEPLLERGVFVQFDQLGRLPTVYSRWDDQDVAAAVIELARRGRSRQLLLSQDTRAKSRLLAYGGGGYGFLAQQFLPYLAMLGADPALAETVTVHNPRRLLTHPAPAQRSDQ